MRKIAGTLLILLSVFFVAYVIYGDYEQFLAYWAAQRAIWQRHWVSMIVIIVGFVSGFFLLKQELK